MTKKSVKDKKPRTKSHFFESIRLFVTNKRVHFVVGMLVCFFTIYIGIAIISYFFTGSSDQSIVKNLAVKDLIAKNGVVSNWAGLRGAYFAEVIINRWFGVSSLFLVFLLGSTGIKWMNLFTIHLLRRFLICSLLTIWSSLFLTFVFRWAVDSTFFLLGGEHGKMLSDMLTANIGFIGQLLVLLAGLILIAILISARTVPVLQGWLSFGKNGEAGKDEEFGKAGSLGEDREFRKAGEFRETGEMGEDETSEETGEVGKTKRTWRFWKKVKGEEKGERVKGEEKGERVKGEEKGERVKGERVKGERVKGERVKGEEKGERVKGERVKGEEKGEKVKGEKDSEFIIEAPKDDDDMYDPASFGAYDPCLDLSGYKFPEITLLKKYDQSEYQVDIAEQNENKNRIKKTLEDFQINISTIKATVGPTITLFEVVPDKGVRISKIRNLEDDIALSLSALGIRIIAPMPGKGTIGIEVPNKKPQIVSMESVIASRKFGESKYELPVVLGRTITNEVFMFDLTKMPHLLVAGATGQGKSVGLNAIITSLLYKKHPAELKLVLIDPKRVEFNMYGNIERHYLAKLSTLDRAIIIDFDHVIETLKSLCKEMDIRYKLLEEAHVRNISEYNAKFTGRHLNPDKGHKYMPYIVVIIDEFGDLIMTAGKEIEMPIARIAQKARAVGIHMIIATQRPSTNIITGIIKANFPARVAFKVSSMIDSRTILDSPGANKLVGHGDMLFSQGNELIRIQGAYVDTDEVENIVTFIGDQAGFETAHPLPEPNDETQEGGIGTVNLADRDPLFEDAARMIVIKQQGSTSHIQRKFSIGYNRAGRLMDQLEAAGIVGPNDGSKGRQVLVTDEYTLEQILTRLTINN